MGKQCKHGEWYTCKRLRMVEYLIGLGFMPDHDMLDPNNLKYKWWKFKNSPELEDAIEKYFEK